MLSKVVCKFHSYRMISPIMRRMISDRNKEILSTTYYLDMPKFTSIFRECDNNDKVIFLDVREGDSSTITQLPDSNGKTSLKKVSIPFYDLMEYELEPIEEFRDTHTILCYSRAGNYAQKASKYLQSYGYTARTVDVNVKDFVEDFVRDIYY